MMGLSSQFLKTLAITPEGTCAKHPHISLISVEAVQGSSSALRECDCCWKEQQERKEQSTGELTATSISLQTLSASEAGAATPPTLQTIPSGAAFPGSEHSATNRDKAWVDSVMARWTQLQEIGHATSSSSGTRTTSIMEDNSGRSTQESFQGSYSVNPLLNMSMAAVAEEHDDKSISISQHNLQFCNRALGSNHTPYITGPQWRRLEEKIDRQEVFIQELQETVQRQETNIRQDLQQLIHLVAAMANSQLQTGAASEQQQAQQQGDASRQTELVRMATELTTRTPLISNTGPNEYKVGDAADEEEVEPPLPPKPRPSLYDKNLSHPANIFTSVRTIERKPPKPPMRHGSFSTHNTSSQRRTSVASSQITDTIVSSLGNSSYNDATTYNDTTTNNDTTTTKTNSNHEEELEIELDAVYGFGVESMLEKERSKPLDIIFDASGKISVDFLEGSILGNGDKEDEEEKKSSSGSGTPRNGSPSSGKSEKSPQIVQKRNSFQKMVGAMRLAIPPDQDGHSEESDKNKSTINPSKLSPAAFYNGRVLRKPAPTSQFNNHLNKNVCNVRPRQPRREPSVTESTANVSHSKPRVPSRNRNLTFPTRASTRYVPPPPPPPPVPRNNNVLVDTQSASSKKPLGRLHPNNLSRLGKSTAPPRREIFATGSSKMQISCLTIDTSLLSDNEPAKAQYDSKTLSEIVYLEVTNLVVTDKFGDRGVYTGTLREEDALDGNDQEEKEEDGSYPRISVTGDGRKVVRIPHGTGTMKYEGGRFYKGDWRDGHWHGNGLLRNSNGDSYEGEFVYDARHGRGIYKYENGDVYEGDFTEDKRHGKGTFMFHNRSVYRGDFVNGDFEGYGWYEFDDGYYEGEWKGGAYHGIGTLQYIDGGSYTGRFAEGKAHGLGEERDADGTIRRGVWNKGELTDNQ